jgi:hypothetical protein
VKPVRAAEILQSLCLPVDLRQQSNAFRQLIREARASVKVAMERFRPSPLVQIHGGPAVDETHQVERAAKNRRVRTHTDRGGVRHLGAVERLDDPPP